MRCGSLFVAMGGVSGAWMMAGWFTRATAAFSRPATRVAVPFQVRCGCGTVLQGIREEAAQTPPCTSCGTRLFVLPASVYPAARGTPGNKSRPKPVRKAKTSVFSEVDERPDAETLTPDSPSEAPPAKGKTRKSREKTAAKSQPAAPPVPRIPIRQRLVLWGRRHPIATLTAALLLLLTMTVAVRTYLQSLETARQVLAEAPRLGREALQKNNPTEAEQQFARAVQAAKRLGIDDPTKRIQQQLWRETTALNRLSPHSLVELAHDAAQARANPGGIDWDAAFEMSYGSSWIVVDTSAITPPLAGTADPTRIDTSLLVNGQPITLLIDLAKLQPPLLDLQPPRLIFAARLAECRPAPNGTGWEIVLDAETACLWASPLTFQQLGFETDPETRKTLREQSEQLGLEPQELPQ